MPCNSGYGRCDCNCNSGNNVSYVRDDSTIDAQAKRIKHLEASLCAIISELEAQNLTTQVIPAASEHGDIDLLEFWNKHKEEDETRILIKLREYSRHEIELVKKMISAYNL